MKSMNFGYVVSFLSIDKGLIEHFGPTGFAKTLFQFVYNFSKTQNGSFFNTIFIVIMFVILILSYYFISVFYLF
jgi:hypothetical protein